GVLAFGAAGAFAALFYTAPPIRLAARRGAGELFVGLCFGPLMTAGAIYALTRELSPMSFLVGVPAGLLTTAILWVNEFPDAASDAKAHRRSEEHTSELQSPYDLVCRLLLEKKNKTQ